MISTVKVTMNKKVFWISAGVAFVIATLAIGVVAVFTTPWYTILCGISLLITLFIADGCKKAVWMEEWHKEAVKKAENMTPKTNIEKQ